MTIRASPSRLRRLPPPSPPSRPSRLFRPRRLAAAGVVAAIAALAVAGGPLAAARAAPVSPLPAVTSADAKKENNLVDAEDIRLRSMFARFGTLTAPTMVQTPGELSTLLLPARSAPYTAEDVVAGGGGRHEVDGAIAFTANVLVGPNARLVISGLSTLRLASGPTGFATLAAWRGGIELAGSSPASPLTVVGWDVQNLAPDAITTDGRAYIRTMGGELIVRNVIASNLGFWDGRTGGISWTGSKGEPSTGGMANATVTKSVFGAYISGSESIEVIGVKLLGNDRSGLAVHRDAVGTLISDTTASSNHGDGMTIDRASGTRIMRSTVQDNSGDGITLDGRGLGLVATASGVQVNQVRDTVVQGNTVSGNGRYGIRIVGGENTLVRSNQVSGSQFGIIVKSGANGTQVQGNTVRTASEAGIMVGPDAKRTALTQNTLADDRRGLIVQDAQTNIISRNAVSGARDFAVTVRGTADGTTIQNNRLAGVGWRAIDVRKATGVRPRDVHSNDTDGWVLRKRQHWWAIFERHPGLIVWGALVILVLLGLWSRRRASKRPTQHPYHDANLTLNRLLARAAETAGAMPALAGGAPPRLPSRPPPMNSGAGPNPRRPAVPAGAAPGFTVRQRDYVSSEDTLTLTSVAERVAQSESGPRARRPDLPPGAQR
jgi:parallel beta-helix repeat protein